MTYVKIHPNLLHHDLSQLVEDFFRPTQTFEKIQTPPVNIYENEKTVEIALKIPGFQKEDITIQIDKGLLLIQGSLKNVEAKEANSKIIRNEFESTSFKKTFTMEDTINQDNIEANYENGILKVILHKNEPEKPITRTIQIK